MAYSGKRARAENRGPQGPEVNRRWQAVIDDHLCWLREKYWNGWRSWRAALYLARGKQWSEQLKNSDALQYAADLVDDVATVPLISMHIENMIGFLTQSDPKFVGTPRRPQDVESAEVQESLLNYTFKEQELGDQHAASLRDFVTIGHGVVGTGYVFPDEVERMTPVKATEGATLNYDESYRPGAAYSRRVNPFFFLKDRHAPDFSLRTARWCGEIFVRPIDDIKQDGNYDAAVRKQVGSAGYQIKTLATWREEQEFLRWKSDDEDYGAEDIGVLVKLYDKRYRRFRILGLGMADPLLDEPWPYDYLDGFPYVMRDFVRIPNEPYGVGFVHFAAHQQLLLNRISTKMSMHARRHNAKYIARGWDADDDQLDLFENDETGTILRGGQASTIEPVQVPQLGEDLYRIHGIVENNMRRLMAEDQLAAGANLPARTSAEEVRTRNKLFGAKLREVVRSSEKLLRDTGRQLLQHIKANADVGQFVRVVGAKGTQFVQLSEDDVRAEVDVDVSSTEADAVDPVTRRQQALDLLQRTIQIVPVANQAAMQQAQAQQASGQPVTASMIQVDYGQLLRAVFKTFDDRELERALPEAPAPPIALPPPPQPGIPGQPQDATLAAQGAAQPQPGG